MDLSGLSWVFHGFFMDASWFFMVYHGLFMVYHGFIMDLSQTLMVYLGFSIMIVGKSGLWEIKPWEQRKKHKPIGLSYDGFSHGLNMMVNMMVSTMIRYAI